MRKPGLSTYLALALKRICGICDWLLPLILLLLWLRLRFLSIFGVGVDYLCAQKVHLWTKGTDLEPKEPQNTPKTLLFCGVHRKRHAPQYLLVFCCFIGRDTQQQYIFGDHYGNRRR
eukprot:619054_1